MGTVGGSCNKDIDILDVYLSEQGRYNTSHGLIYDRLDSRFAQNRALKEYGDIDSNDESFELFHRELGEMIYA